MWKEAGEITKAINYYREALAIKEEIYEPNHHEVSHYFSIRMLQIFYARQMFQHHWVSPEGDLESTIELLA